MAQVYIEDEPAFPMMEPPQDLMPYYGPVGTEREARGFIAPFVDEFGTTQSTAYDSLESDIAAEVQARRLKGQMDFDKLVQGGATPSEALRLTAPDLFAGDPAKMARAIPKTPASFDPSFTNVEGGRIFRRGPSSAQFIPTPPQRLSLETLARQKLIEQELSGLKRTTSLDRLMEEGAGGNERAARIAELEREYLANASNPGITPASSGIQQPAQPQTLTRQQASEFLRQAGGDKNKARKLARDAGFSF